MRAVSGLRLASAWQRPGRVGFAEAVSSDEYLAVSVIDAHDTQGKLTEPGATRSTDDRERQDDQKKLDLLLTDQRVKQWMDAGDLVTLLKMTVTHLGWDFSVYTQLARTVSEVP